MKSKIILPLVLSIFALVFFASAVSAATLATWSLNTTAATQTSVSADTGINANVVAGSFTAGPGVSDPTTSAISKFDVAANGATIDTSWVGAVLGTDGITATNATAAVTGDAYFQVTITPNTGFNYVVNSISFDTITTDADGMNFAIRTSADNYASDVATGVSSTTSASKSLAGLKVSAAATEVLTIKIYGYNAALTTDTFSIKNLKVSGDLVPTEVISCFTDGDPNSQLTIDSLDLSVETGYGEDDEWYLLDLVNIESNVEYNGDSDFEMKNIEVQWGLFDRDTNKWIIDDTEKDFDLEGGDDQDVNIQLKLDEKIDKLAAGDIVAYLIATGEDEENADAKTCGYVETPVNMQSENAIILDNIQYPNTAVQCSAEVTVTADVWNIGDEKLENAYILVNNLDLGIVDERIDLEDISDFDNAADLSFTFTVPSDLDEKSYNILFEVYDEDDDLFEIANDDSSYTVSLSVAGNCEVVGEATVTANIASGGKAGEPLTVMTTVKNSGTRTANYVLSATGYSLWATSATLDNSSFSLNAGESKDVFVTLNVKEDASGEQKFNVEVVSGNNKIVMTQPVSVMIEGNSGLFSGLTGNSILGGNGGYFWFVALLNVLLVAGIIYIVIRLFRK
ncbi:MAG: putative S-layer protein [archaeon]